MANTVKSLVNNPKIIGSIETTLLGLDITIYFIDEVLKFDGGDLLPIAVIPDEDIYNIFITDYDSFIMVDPYVQFFVLCHEIGHIMNEGKFENEEEDEAEADKFAHKMLKDREISIDKTKVDTLFSYFEKVFNGTLSEERKMQHYNRFIVE